MALEERESQYSPSSCIGGHYQPFMVEYRTQSQEARTDCQDLGATWHELRYGALPAQRIDLVVPPESATLEQRKPGLLVFIHGGYWQLLSAQDSLFPARGCVQHGHAFAAIDYTLAPHASLPQIVQECRQAFLCLRDQAAAYGFDATRMVVAGSSAGAHLAAMLAWPGWTASDANAPGATALVRAAVLVSGVFELEPLVGTGINTALGLDAAQARSVSPALLPLAGFPDVLLAFGDNETGEFKRQTQHFARDLLAAGASAETLEIAGRNHFDVILDLANSHTDLGARTLSLLQSP